jgi:cytochrome c
MKRFALFALLAASAFPVDANESLAQRYACAACHQSDFRVGGPSWREISARYKDTSQIAASIRSGSSGKWGTIPMAPQPQVGDADLEKLARWIAAR